MMQMAVGHALGKIRKCASAGAGVRALYVVDLVVSIGHAFAQKRLSYSQRARYRQYHQGAAADSFRKTIKSMY